MADKVWMLRQLGGMNGLGEPVKSIHATKEGAEKTALKLAQTIAAKDCDEDIDGKSLACLRKILKPYAIFIEVKAFTLKA